MAASHGFVIISLTIYIHTTQRRRDTLNKSLLHYSKSFQFCISISLSIFPTLSTFINFVISFSFLLLFWKWNIIIIVRAKELGRWSGRGEGGVADGTAAAAPSKWRWESCSGWSPADGGWNRTAYSWKLLII